MGEISILDLQNLRHLIGGYATTSGRHQNGRATEALRG